MRKINHLSSRASTRKGRRKTNLFMLRHVWYVNSFSIPAVCAHFAYCISVKSVTKVFWVSLEGHRILILYPSNFCFVLFFLAASIDEVTVAVSGTRKSTSFISFPPHSDLSRWVDCCRSVGSGNASLLFDHFVKKCKLYFDMKPKKINKTLNWCSICQVQTVTCLPIYCPLAI